ncbi:response regulator [Allomuricauda sp. d1]|uniref:response regulator n=1 Tax=Allomuricauda sp. d1 TaxID=3136725 RepID=UPI0031E060C4
MQNINNFKLAVLIDDDEVTNYLNTLFFKKASVFDHVVAFENASDALSFLEDSIQNATSFPELIMVDINMPCISGWQFLEEYLKIGEETRKNTMVVMLSIQFCEDDIKMFEKYQDHIVLQEKPLSTAKIQNWAKRLYAAI